MYQFTIHLFSTSSFSSKKTLSISNIIFLHYIIKANSGKQGVYLYTYVIRLIAACFHHSSNISHSNFSTSHINYIFLTKIAKKTLTAYDQKQKILPSASSCSSTSATALISQLIDTIDSHFKWDLLILRIHLHFDFSTEHSKQPKSIFKKILVWLDKTAENNVSSWLTIWSGYIVNLILLNVYITAHVTVCKSNGRLRRRIFLAHNCKHNNLIIKIFNILIQTIFYPFKWKINILRDELYIYIFHSLSVYF